MVHLVAADSLFLTLGEYREQVRLSIVMSKVCLEPQPTLRVNTNVTITLVPFLSVGLVFYKMMFFLPHTCLTLKLKRNETKIQDFFSVYLIILSV